MAASCLFLFSVLSGSCTDFCSSALAKKHRSSAQYVVLATGSLVWRRYRKGGGHLLLRHFIRMFKSTHSSAEDSAVYLPEVFLLVEFSGQSNHRV